MSEASSVSDFVDARPFTRFQAGVVALCTAVVFVEGFDAQSIGYVAPSITRALHLAPGALGPAFGAGLLGLMLGAMFIAPFSDRIGRRGVIIGSTLAFGLLSLTTLLAHSVPELVAIRLLTGLGLGAAMPTAISLTAEYSPHRRKGLIVMVMFCGFSLGSAVGGFVAAQMIADFGWTSVFLVGGILPLLLVPILVFALPESLQYLALQKGTAGRTATLMRRIDRRFTGAGLSASGDAAGAKAASVRELFVAGRMLPTLLLWTVFAMSLLDINLVASWLPTTLNAGGASLELAAATGAVFQLGGIAGTLLLGLTIDRMRPEQLLVGAYLLGAVCIGLIAYADARSATMLIIVAGAGFGIVGGQIAANAVSAMFYPTHIRSTGVGWALGVGRLGSIIGPTLGGFLLSLRMAPAQLFLLSVVPTLIAALACLGLALLKSQRPLPTSVTSAAE